jgi:Signal transduction histidine kinase
MHKEEIEVVEVLPEQVETEPVAVKKPTKSAKKRMSSITRKLHWQLVRSKMGLFFIENLLIIALMGGGWAYMQESHSEAGFDIERERTFVTETTFTDTEYVVYDTEGKEIVRANIFPDFAYLVRIIIVVFVFQNLSLLFGLYGESRRIRKTLKPINDIAVRADQLNRLTLSDGSKYLEIESAIESIKPGEEAPLSLQDKDLEGIEAAMNNLLIRMKETYQQQARFVNDASHELRTPIAVIQGYANMLERWGREDPEVLDESIHAIVHEADHMNKLVEQLLFLARGDSGKTILKKEELSLNAMMQEIYEESLMIDENHIYKYKAPEEEIKINADETLLKQAVRILLDNAAKYTEKKDEIKLAIGRNEKGLPYLQVQDTGIGMAEADVQHMFERFYRSDETREIKGTGLGLSIAKWIVDKHNGHFEILSRTELGTRIRIVLGE